MFDQALSKMTFFLSMEGLCLLKLLIFLFTKLIMIPHICKHLADISNEVLLLPIYSFLLFID